MITVMSGTKMRIACHRNNLVTSGVTGHDGQYIDDSAPLDSPRACASSVLRPNFIA